MSSFRMILTVHTLHLFLLSIINEGERLCELEGRHDWLYRKDDDDIGNYLRIFYPCFLITGTHTHISCHPVVVVNQWQNFKLQWHSCKCYVCSHSTHRRRDRTCSKMTWEQERHIEWVGQRDKALIFIPWLGGNFYIIRRIYEWGWCLCGIQ